VDALLRHLADPVSPIRAQAARALGRIGDSRAVPRLVEGLEDRSEELQEACCDALGRMGARDSLPALLRLLSAERSDRVVAAAGEAMSRLGSFEAALELLPRMIDTASRALRRQIAIALGNLLGKPQGFYVWLTGDAASRATTLARWYLDAQRAVVSQARRSPETFESSTTRQAIATSLRGLRVAVEAQDPGRVVRLVHDTLFGLCRLLSGQDIPEDEALGFAFLHSPQLGLALWFASEVKARAAGASVELLEIEAGLGVYALASYHEVAEGDRVNR
jgi:hypothetical protein